MGKSDSSGMRGARLGVSKLGKSVRTVLVLAGGPVLILRGRVGKWFPSVPLFQEGSLCEYCLCQTQSEMSE